MELRGTREMRRNERLSKTAAKKADTMDAPARPQAQPVRKQAPDKCTLSRQALAYLEQQNELQRKLDEQRASQQSRWAEAQDKSGELDMLEKGLDVLDKCMKIAAAIMRGDKVPMKDLKYLMDNDANGYKLAMALRREKKDPEECKSVLDDEEGRQDSAGGDGGDVSTSAPAVSGSGESASVK